MKRNRQKVIGELRAVNSKLVEKRSQLAEFRKAGTEPTPEFQQELETLTSQEYELRSEAINLEDDEITQAVINGATTAAMKGDTNQPDEYRSAFASYLRAADRSDISPDHRKLLNERRALAVGSVDGGNIVDKVTLTTVYEEKVTWGALYGLTKKITTSGGNIITWPTSEEGLSRGVIIGENQNHGKSDSGFGTEQMGAHKISSRIILVSDELLQDAMFDIASYITRIARQRVDLGIDYYLVHGTGVDNNPKGLLLQLKSSKKIKNTGTTPANLMDNVIDVIHGVDPAYRAMPNFRVAVNDNSLAWLRKWKDTNGNPIYIRDPKAEWPDTLFGEKLVIDNNLPDFGENGWVFAGDWQSVAVRLAGEMAVKRFDELYGETGQVGFMAWRRFGIVLEDKAAMAAGFYTGFGEKDVFETTPVPDLSGIDDNNVVTNAPHHNSAGGSTASGIPDTNPPADDAGAGGAGGASGFGQ